MGKSKKLKTKLTDVYFVNLICDKNIIIIIFNVYHYICPAKCANQIKTYVRNDFEFHNVLELTKIFTFMSFPWSSLLKPREIAVKALVVRKVYTDFIQFRMFSIVF